MFSFLNPPSHPTIKPNDLWIGMFLIAKPLLGHFFTQEFPWFDLEFVSRWAVEKASFVTFVFYWNLGVWRRSWRHLRAWTGLYPLSLWNFQETIIPHCGSHAVACRSLLNATSMREVLHDVLALFPAHCLKVGFNNPKEVGGHKKAMVS